LDIPYRLQRNDADGYCGETAVSSACVFFGCWISPEEVRQRVTGDQSKQVLADTLMAAQLTRMRLASSMFDTTANGGAVSYQKYMLWVKSKLASFYPVITTVYAYSAKDNEYDHIELAVGYDSASPSDFTTYAAADSMSQISFIVDTVCAPAENNCFFTAKTATRTFSDWVAVVQRTTGGATACFYDFSAGGCFPKTKNYGISVDGPLDASAQALPVRLRHVAGLTNATASIYVGVQMRDLTAGSSYSLVRYDAPANVPASPSSADAFLDAAHQSACTFKASGSSVEYCDPTALAWTSSYVYRLVNNAKLSPAKVPAAACASSGQMLALGACPLTGGASDASEASKRALIIGLAVGLGGGALALGLGVGVFLAFKAKAAGAAKVAAAAKAVGA
jgi:hypothetical protein